MNPERKPKPNNQQQTTNNIFKNNEILIFKMFVFFVKFPFYIVEGEIKSEELGARSGGRGAQPLKHPHTPFL